MIMHILISMKNGWSVYYSWPVCRLTHAETHCGSVHVSVFAELFKCVFIMYLIYQISLHGSKHVTWIEINLIIGSLFCLNPANKLTICLKKVMFVLCFSFHHIFYISCHFVPWNHSQPFVYILIGIYLSLSWRMVLSSDLNFHKSTRWHCSLLYVLIGNKWESLQRLSSLRINGNVIGEKGILTLIKNWDGWVAL